QGRMNRPNEDLSTSEIVSTSRPIGVISGHVQTPITADQAVSSPLWTGHQAAMILTDSLWGKEYFSVPSRSGGDRFRLMPAFDGTTVTITHFPPGGGISTKKVTLDRGDILDTAAINGQAITGPVHWSATGPMILMQLRTSGAYGDPENNPSSIPLPAANNFSSYSVFAAPDQMGGDAFTSHTLTIIGTGGSSGTPMSGIRLDGKELGAVDASAVAQRIGNTDYYYVVMHIGSGGHILSSDDGTVFAGTLRGSNGTLARDAYAWTLPYWSLRVATDARPPYVMAPSVSGNKLTATISDSAASYFSGVAGVTVVRNPKWQLDGPFVAPAQSENVSVTFTATGDPSGPLWVALTDRAGNIDTVKISDGICSRPASADRDNIRLSTPVTIGTRDSVLVTANPCGDSARVISVDPGTGNAVPYLHVGFAQATPFTIQGHGAIRLVVTVDPIAQKGSYTTTITVTLDGGATIVLPLQIEVTPPAGVDADAVTGSMELTVYPNPFASATTITTGGPLGGSATVTISDQLGRTIREIAGERLAGKTSILWDGLDGRGIAAPTGIYFIRLNDGGHQAVRNVTLIR
ncbi:MAG: T9SS type A sorting domain-containing protein, partial [Candidatus Kapaibacterium sp.]